MRASEAGQVEAVKLLFQNGADVFAREPAFGFSAIHMAAAQGHANVVGALLDHNGRVLTATDSRGGTFVHVALLMEEFAVLDHLLGRLDGETAMQKDLFRREDIRGNSALSLVARAGQAVLVRKLIPFASARQIFSAQRAAAALPTQTRAQTLARWQIQHDLFTRLMAIHQEWPLSA